MKETPERLSIRLREINRIFWDASISAKQALADMIRDAQELEAEHIVLMERSAQVRDDICHHIEDCAVPTTETLLSWWKILDLSVGIGE